MNPIVFVAGATGYTGQAVVAQCVAKSLRTIAHVRPDSPGAAQWHHRLGAMGAQIDSTAWQASQMTTRLAQLRPSHVFALLGTTKKSARQQGIADPYQNIDYTLTAMLIDAAAAVSPPPRLIYLSAMGATNGASAYLRARWQTEQHLLASSCPAIIARPGLISGDRLTSRPAESIAYALAQSVSTLLCATGARTWANQTRPLRAAELARALVALAFAPSPAGIVAAHTLAQLSSQDMSTVRP